MKHTTTAMIEFNLKQHHRKLKYAFYADLALFVSVGFVVANIIISYV